MDKAEMMVCKHPLIQWVGMPYDQEKGGAYYRLFCASCEADLVAETYLPGTLEPFRNAFYE